MDNATAFILIEGVTIAKNAQIIMFNLKIKLAIHYALLIRVLARTTYAMGMDLAGIVEWDLSVCVTQDLQENIAIDALKVINCIQIVIAPEKFQISLLI